jgi:hypothetical protein
MILEEAHGGIAEGHYAGRETTKNIFAQVFGGIHFTRCEGVLFSHVMYAKEWEIHLGGMKFL